MGPISGRSSVEGHVYADEHHSIAISGNMILTYSKTAPTPRYMAAWDQAIAGLATRHPGAIWVVTIIDGSTPPPDEASRKAIRQALAKHQKQIAALAYVIEGRGFASAAIRSVLSLLSLAARYPFPQKVFATAKDAAAWLSSCNGFDSSGSSPLGVLERMRGEVALRAAG